MPPSVAFPDGPSLHGDKYEQMWSLNVMFVCIWLGAGTFIGVYVRGQMKEPAQRNSYCFLTFWLVGLAVLFMWLLWFSMYSAQLNP